MNFLKIKKESLELQTAFCTNYTCHHLRLILSIVGSSVQMHLLPISLGVSSRYFCVGDWW
jgi:hypothetical protein